MSAVIIQRESAFGEVAGHETVHHIESLKNDKQMEEKSALNVNINIYGGTNQILPNATKAEQHFYYRAGQPATPVPDTQPRPWTADDERRLSLYIDKEETLQAYIATLAACTTAQQVGEAVADMCANEPKLDGELIVKEKFIRLLLPFLVCLEKGKGIDNLRVNINNAWMNRKRQLRKPTIG